MGRVAKDSDHCAQIKMKIVSIALLGYACLAGSASAVQVTDPCPGGSLAGCIALCPSSPPTAYQACVEDCKNRCPSKKVETSCNITELEECQHEIDQAVNHCTVFFPPGLEGIMNCINDIFGATNCQKCICDALPAICQGYCSINQLVECKEEIFQIQIDCGHLNSTEEIQTCIDDIIGATECKKCICDALYYVHPGFCEEH